MRSFAFLISLLAPVAAAAQMPPLPPDTQFLADVAYVTAGHERQTLDIAFFRSGPPRPLLVWIHGGAYAGGDKGENRVIWGELMARGYAVATINYRLSGDAKWPAQIADCKAALRFLRARAGDYRIDPERIGVWGSSAGGHLAALVGASGGERKFDVGEHTGQSSGARCVVDLFGPVDFERMPLRHDPNSPEAKLWGRATVEALDRAREASPLTYLNADTPPFLIIHGDADEVIAIEQSRILHAALEQAGGTSEFVTLPGAGHSHEEVWTRERGRILAFFDRHLRGGGGPDAKP
jgi:acetyl esterase/lipase